MYRSMQPFPLLLIGVAALCLATTAVAETSGGGTCYNCRSFAGSWECDTFSSTSGGTSCTVSGDSCTVSGNCRGNGIAHAVTIDAAVVHDVANLNPGVALTLARLSLRGRVDAEMSTTWSVPNPDLADVQTVLAGGQLQSRANHERTHQIYFETLDATTAMLMLSPGQPWPDQSFRQLSMLFETVDGELVPTVWLLD